MGPKRESGPDPDEITTWITTSYPETVVASALGATFFSLDERHWPSRETFDQVVKPLIGEAYARLARQRRRRQPE